MRKDSAALACSADCSILCTRLQSSIDLRSSLHSSSSVCSAGQDSSDGSWATSPITRSSSCRFCVLRPTSNRLHSVRCLSHKASAASPDATASARPVSCPAAATAARKSVSSREAIAAVMRVRQVSSSSHRFMSSCAMPISDTIPPSRVEISVPAAADLATSLPAATSRDFSAAASRPCRAAPISFCSASSSSMNSSSFRACVRRLSNCADAAPGLSVARRACSLADSSFESMARRSRSQLAVSTRTASKAARPCSASDRSARPCEAMSRQTCSSLSPSHALLASSRAAASCGSALHAARQDEHSDSKVSTPAPRDVSARSSDTRALSCSADRVSISSQA